MSNDTIIGIIRYEIFYIIIRDSLLFYSHNPPLGRDKRLWLTNPIFAYKIVNTLIDIVVFNNLRFKSHSLL